MFNPYFADVSSAQPHVDMHAYANAGHLMIAIKSTEGTGYVNPYHHGQTIAAHMHHVAVVHYHFARPDANNDPTHEARHFLDVALPLAGWWDYLVLDFERSLPSGFSRDPTWTEAFDAYVREHCRYRTILYESRSWLQQSDRWLIGAPARVWDADWSLTPDFAPPGYETIFRQLSDGVVGPGPHSYAGIGQCDSNRMNRRTFNHLLSGRR